ncbi:hypothetical protein pb186bvf_008525 [Paramecium bursaria]
MLKFLYDSIDFTKRPEQPKVKLNSTVKQEFEIQVYQKYIKQKIINTLNTFIGKKVLIIDQFVAEMLTFVVDNDLMRENGIEVTYHITSEVISIKAQQVIFFVQPQRNLMKRIVRIIRDNQLQQLQIKYLLIFCPSSNVICKDYLEKEAVLGHLQLKNFNFDLIPIQPDVLSLEINNAVNQLYIQNDLTILHLVAESIQRMQLIHGKFQNVFCKGNYAKAVIDILKQKPVMEEDEESNESKLYSLFIVDRKIDLITPMLTPFTYEAILDDLYGIKQNQVVFTCDDPTIAQLKDKTLKLSQDSIFNNYKLYNVREFLTVLEQKRIENKTFLKTKNEQRSAEETEQFVIKFRQIQKEHNFVLDHYIVSTYIKKQIEQISFHMQVTNEVNAILQNKQKQIEQTIENFIQIEYPVQKVFRLLGLYCQMFNGISSKTYDHLRRELIHVYGFEYIYAIKNLEKLGLIGNKIFEQPLWERIEKPLRLINADIDPIEPEDMSFVYLAYAPIIVRMFEEIITKNGWSNILQTIKEIPGEIVIQQNPNPIQSNCYVIYFIGGVTYGEIHALRWLSLRYQKEIIICTTHILSGDRLIDECLK